MLFHSCWKVDCQFVTGEHSSSDMKSCLWIALLVTLAIGTKTQDFDLSDAFDSDDPIPTTIPKQPKQPAKDPSPGGGFDLLDALGPEEPEKPAGIPPKEGGTDPKPAPPPAPVDPKNQLEVSKLTQPAEVTLITCNYSIHTIWNQESSYQIIEHSKTF
ncbi:CD99 antigen-like isoform X2 [Coregonus clupeaformis]|uniref:CD99 antigen-like isoform X2 n=1 Tax=Coregonus clupeaformis TaxID=59861 RepID=UPI001E1C46BC|nr:CD99 antigen-like isoform X2 [Coregonus clupeaformis]